MKRRICISLSILVLSWAGALCASGQTAEKPDKKKSETGQVDVRVNLLVLDPANNPVGDLKREDVRVFEDGVEQTLTQFVKKEPGLNIGIVVDNSGSLRSQFSKIIKAAQLITVNLGENDEAFIVRFVSSDKVELVQDWTTDKKELLETIGLMFIEGGKSSVLDAVYLSAEKIVEREKSAKAKRNALVLITDGDDRESYYKLSEVLPLFNNSDVQVFSLAITRDLRNSDEYLLGPDRKKRAERLVDILGYKTGGKAFILGEKFNEDQLKEVLRSIMIELRSQYVISYTSTNPKRGGAARKLRVEVRDASGGTKRTGYIREDFVVPKE